MAIEHPAERGGEGRGFFERVAERASNVASSPVFFAFCSAAVLVWMLSYAAGWSDDLRAFLGDLLAAITLALVALIKNAERRAEHAVQYKLDAIAQALLEMQQGKKEGGIEDLEAAVGLHEDV
jgi:low affinity Fe/Cu permease